LRMWVGFISLRTGTGGGSCPTQGAEQRLFNKQCPTVNFNLSSLTIFGTFALKWTQASQLPRKFVKYPYYLFRKLYSKLHKLGNKFIQKQVVRYYVVLRLCIKETYHIIITGSTALRGPWPSSEASVSLSIRLLLLQIS
jgi:hypothetical protein